MAYRPTRRAALAGLIFVAGAALDACARPAWLHRSRLPRLGNPFARSKGRLVPSLLPVSKTANVAVGQGANAQLTITMPPTTAGNLIVVCWCYTTSGVSIISTSVVDTTGNSYVLQYSGSSTSGALYLRTSYAKNIAASSGNNTVTISLNNNGSVPVFWGCAFEIPNADPTTPLTQQTTSSGSSSAPATGSITNSNANSLIVAFAANLDTSNPATLTPASPYTDEKSLLNNGTIAADVAVQQVSSSTAQSETWTAGASASWATNIVAVQAAPPTPVVVAPNDANWYWTPGNWLVSSASAESVNPGAKFILSWSIPSGGAGQFTLTVDTTPMGGAGLSSGSYPTLEYSVDDGAITTVQLSGNSASSTPISLTGLAAGQTHTIVCWFKSIDINTGDRWNTPVQVVKIISATIDNGAATVPLSGTTFAPASGSLLVFGDSVTEAFNSLVSGQQDALASYAHPLARALDCEAGVVGFSGQGYTKVGNAAGNVPTFHTPGNTAQQTWRWYWSGQSRLSGGLFSPMPTYILLFLGYNDNASTDATVEAAVADCLAQMRAACGTAKTPIFCVPMLSQHKLAAIQTGYQNYQTSTPDPLSHFADLSALYGIADLIAGTTKGSASLYTFDGTHPNSLMHGMIAGMLAAAMRRILDGPKRVAMLGGM